MNRLLKASQAAVLLLCVFLTAGVQADTVYLKNGDRITGDVGRVWDDELYIEPPLRR